MLMASIDESKIEIVNHFKQRRMKSKEVVNLGTDPDGCDGEGDR